MLGCDASHIVANTPPHTCGYTCLRPYLWACLSSLAPVDNVSSVLYAVGAAARSKQPNLAIVVRVSASRSRCAAGHPSRDLGSRTESELGENAFDVAVGGALGDEQSLGDFTVGQAVLDQLGDLEFSFRQQRVGICVPGFAPVISDTEHETDDIVKITEPLRDTTIIGGTTCRSRWRMPCGEPG